MKYGKIWNKIAVSSIGYRIDGGELDGNGIEWERDNEWMIWHEQDWRTELHGREMG